MKKVINLQRSRARIKKEKTTFLKIKNVCARKDLDRSLCVRLVWCYVIHVLLYDMEGWALSSELEKRIETLDVFIYRHFLEKSWKNIVINEEVLRHMSKEREL